MVALVALAASNPMWPKSWIGTSALAGNFADDET
jgi:hypothetical protein